MSRLDLCLGGHWDTLVEPPLPLSLSLCPSFSLGLSPSCFLCPRVELQKNCLSLPSLSHALSCQLCPLLVLVAQMVESTCNAGDVGLVPGLGRSPGGGNGTLLQYSCLENPMDRGAWWAAAQGGSKSWTRLSNRARTHIQEDPGALLNDHCLPPVHEGQLLAQLFCQ